MRLLNGTFFSSTLCAISPKIMKRIIILIFSISLFSFINYNSDLKKEKYFEGQVTYEIEYSPYDKKFQPERIKELVGSKMILTFKKGNYKKEYFSPNGKLLQERILNLKDKKSYLRTSDSDTIYWMDITKNDSKTSFEILNDSIILNHPCTVIKTKTIVSGDNFNGRSFEVGGLFKYAKDLPINPSWYKDYKEANFNEIAKSGKGIAIVTINKGIYWEQKINVKTITERKVKKRELKINLNNAPLKEL